MNTYRTGRGETAAACNHSFLRSATLLFDGALELYTAEIPNKSERSIGTSGPNRNYSVVKEAGDPMFNYCDPCYAQWKMFGVLQCGYTKVRRAHFGWETISPRT